MEGQHGMHHGPNKSPVWDERQKSSWKQFQTYQQQQRSYDERKTRVHEMNMKMFEFWSNNQNQINYFNPGVPLECLQSLLKNISNSLQTIFLTNIFIHKSMVSGFWSFVCMNCLPADFPIPIKDLGHDLSAYGRHTCNSNACKLENPEERHSLLANLFEGDINYLKVLVDIWTPDEKFLFAEKM